MKKKRFYESYFREIVIIFSLILIFQKAIQTLIKKNLC